jgi:hypothetical protein
VKPNGSTGFATRRNIVENNFIAPGGGVAARETQRGLTGGAGADLKRLLSPDETKFCSDRHRPVSTFPPVFTGLSDFSLIGVGFHPIYKSMKPAETGVDCGRHREPR